MNRIHPEQGAVWRMCHFDDVLDPSGIICAYLILCCLILIREDKVMDMMSLSAVQMLVWVHWL